MPHLEREAEKAQDGIPRTRGKTGLLASDDSILAVLSPLRAKLPQTRLDLLKQCFRLFRCFFHEKSHLRMRSLEIDEQTVRTQSF
jgi:hypothetical protein